MSLNVINYISYLVRINVAIAFPYKNTIISSLHLHNRVDTENVTSENSAVLKYRSSFVKNGDRDIDHCRYVQSNYL